MRFAKRRIGVHFASATIWRQIANASGQALHLGPFIGVATRIGKASFLQSK
jgi:hypothetical protein